MSPMSENTSLDEKMTLTATMKLVDGPEKFRLLQMYRQYHGTCENHFNLVSGWRNGDKIQQKAYEEFATKSSTPHMRTVEAGFYNSTTTKNAQAIATKSLKGMIGKGTFPIYLPSPDYDFSSCRYRCSVSYEALKRINSWIESDKSTQAFYKERSDRFILLGKHFEKEYSREALEAFMYFYNEVTRNMNGRLNQKFFSFFHFQLRPALLEGKPIYKGRWVDGKGRRRVYVMNDNKIVDLLQSLPILWKDEKCLMNDPNLCGNSDSEEVESLGYIDLHEGLNGFDKEGKDGKGRWKKNATLTPPNIFNSPVRLEIGFHYVNPKNLNTDNVNKKVSFSLPMPNRKDGEEEQPLNLVWSYGQKHRQCMLEDLEFKYNGDHTGNYTFNFAHNGKLPITASVAQMSIKLIIHNKNMNLDKPNTDDFDFVLYIPYGYEVHPPCGLTIEELNKEAYNLRRAYPSVQNRKNLKNIKGEKASKLPVGTIFIAADIGLNPVVNIAAYKTRKDGLETLEEISIESENQKVFREYRDNIRAFQSVKRLLDQTRDWLTEENPADVFEQRTFDEINAYTGLNITTTQYVEWLVAHKDIPRYKWHNKEYQWYPSVALFIMYQKHLKLSKDRMFSDSAEDTCLYLKWVEAMEERKSATTAVKNFGHVRVLGHKNKDGYFVEETERMDNIKDDFCKKISRSIFDCALNHKASFVVIEQFINRHSDKCNTKKENKQFQTWIVGQLKKRIFIDGKKFGIAVIEVDERYTSQIDANTKTPGYRDEEDPNILHTINGPTNCHFNACNNFVDRAISHHTDLRSLEFVQGKNGVWTPSAALTIGAEDKREKGLLSKHYGYYNLCFVEGRGRLVPDKRKEWSRSLFKNIEKKETFFVLDDTYKEWVNKDEMKQFVSSIEDGVLIE